MKVAIYTLGCKVNQYETQAMEQLLRERGHQVVDFSQEADAYVVNTCSVTAVSDQKSRQMIRHIRRQRPGAVVVMLIPARTDTLAFHKYIYHKAEIRFIKGRLRFWVNGQTGDAAPFPSMVVIFRGPEAREEENA